MNITYSLLSQRNKIFNIHHSQSLLFSLFIIITISSLICQTQSQYTKSCHYSCKYCADIYYTHCIICQDTYTLNPIKNINNTSLYYNTLQQHPWGSCIVLLSSQINIFGLIIFIINVLAFIILKNRTIFYFLNTLQMFALFSLIQISYTEVISYVAQGLQYFMLISSLNKVNKPKNIQIYNGGRYRMYQFIRQYNFKANFEPIFIFSLITFIIALVIPLCRYCSKKQESLWSICNCINIQKLFIFIEITSIIIFFFLIQQSILMISIGLGLDSEFTKQGGNIVLVVIYALMIAIMIINICSKNMDIFGNKVIQQIQIIKKCITPVFMILPIKANIAVAGFMLLAGVIELGFSRICNKDKKLTQFHQKLIRRQFRYRIIELFVIVMLILYWVIQKYVKSLKASNIIGIVGVVILGVYILCLLIQIMIQLYGRYCLKQNQKLYQLLSSSMTSLRQSKMLQQTLQNFQTTEQGILDMIFFGRNYQQKQSPKKSNNIQLNLDNIQEIHQSYNQDGKTIKSATTSPNNKDYKNRTARTPKNDRSSRFKLNKVFQPDNLHQIQNIQMKLIKMQNNQTKQTKMVRQDQSITNQPKFQDKSQRSDIVSIKPKTSRRQQAIKTVRQIKVQIRDDISNEVSPRFIQGQQQDGSHIKIKKEQEHQLQQKKQQQLIKEKQLSDAKQQLSNDKQQQINDDNLVQQGVNKNNRS